jgi:hypothetical protein
MSMMQLVQAADFESDRFPLRLDVVRRADLARFPCWRRAFGNERKDHRYYELVEDTLHPEFEYRYFAIRVSNGEVCAVQPFFLLDQDLLVGLSPRFGPFIDCIRRIWPRLTQLRTLMVGCVAGEGHLDGGETCGRRHANLLANLITGHARALGASLIVLKEFPARYRSALDPFINKGFTRVPSFPMTRLSINYANFDEYMNRALNSATRRKLRKKFRAAEHAPAIEMSIVDDVTSGCQRFAQTGKCSRK